MTDEVHWLIGENIADARTEAGLSSKELALKSGISAERVADIEAGIVRATAEELFAVATGLGIRVQDLYRRF